MTLSCTVFSSSVESVEASPGGGASASVQPLGEPHVLERPGCRLHYWVYGPVHGRPLLLLHAGGLDHHQFDGQMELLVRRFRVFAPDLRGHGRSFTDAAFTLEHALADLWALLDVWALQRVQVMGVALGGLLAQLLHAQAPERVDGLVLMSCLPLYREPPSWWVYLAGRMARGLVRLLPFWIIQAQTAVRMGNRGRVQRYASAALARSGKHHLLATWDQVAQTWARSTPPLPAQTLVLHGVYDRVLPAQALARVWAQHHPRVERISVPGAGHSVLQDNPLFVNAVLAERFWTDDRGDPGAMGPRGPL